MVTTPGESFCPGIEQPQGSHSVLGWNDSRGIILSWAGTVPGESFHSRTEGLQGSHSVLGWNNSRGVILSWDRTAPRGVILSCYRTTTGELIRPGME